MPLNHDVDATARMLLALASAPPETRTDTLAAVAKAYIEGHLPMFVAILDRCREAGPGPTIARDADAWRWQTYGE